MELPPAMPEEAGLEPRRQAVIDVLKDRFARGEIELAEYERRIAAAAEARRAGELAALVSDLGRSAAPLPSVPDEKQRFVTVMGSRAEHGDWLRADSVEVYVLMGSVSLDFTGVRPGDRPVVVELYSMMSEAPHLLTFISLPLSYFRIYCCEFCGFSASKAGQYEVLFSAALS